MMSARDFDKMCLLAQDSGWATGKSIVRVLYLEEWKMFPFQFRGQSLN